MVTQKNREYKKGIIYALSCSVLWGVLPIYWQALRPIESSVIIFYRIFLVGFVCFLLSLKMYGMAEMRKYLRPKGNKLKFFLAGVLITANWSIYIWAVNADFVIQTCVGYYIEPLMVSVFGIIFFKEKLTKYKLIALVFALAGVVVMLVHFMEVPLIALTLALTFATYAALKKSYNLPSVLSLFYETMYLALPALVVIIYLEVTGQGAIESGTPIQYVLLMFCGPLTALALAFFAEAANKVPLVTLGLIEYVSPSISLILGIFLFKEPFDLVQFIAFVIVWIGLVFFTIGERNSSVAAKASETKPSGATKTSGGEEHDIFDIFADGFDRFAFPGNVHRVTAGNGGEALLIIGSEKTALLDCGMAYCGKQMLENIERVLREQKRDTLSFVFLTHSHYDHIGALPYVRKAYPQATVYGSKHCRDILIRPNAKALIKELGTVAADLYINKSSANGFEIPADNFEVDIVLADNDTVSLGKETIRALETKGHTDCSLSYALEPLKLLFTSESTGILQGKDYVHTPALKSFNDAFAAEKKCITYGANYICLPHFGMLPADFNDRYWQIFDKECHVKIDFVTAMKAAGKSNDDILDEYVEKYWQEGMEKEQPKEAFIINSKNIIKTIINEI